MLALYISLLDTEEQISKFEHIYTKYRGLMFYTAKGVLQDSYLAEDAVHETFLDIIRIIDSIRANNEKELSQFLRVLTHHKAVDMVRKCTRQKKSDTEIEDNNQAIWGIMDDDSNTLLWESSTLSFQVRGNLSITELIKISEGIEIQ